MEEVYAQTKKALLPQCMLLVGPKASGKTSVAKLLETKIASKSIDYAKFLVENALTDQLDEDKIGKFIQHLARDRANSVVLENFPENH